MSLIKNTASQFLYAVLVSSADGSAITSGATLTLAKDGAASAAAGATLTHRAGGLWEAALTQADTNASALGYVWGGTLVIPQGGHIQTVDYPRSAIPAFAAGANGGAPVLSSSGTTLAYTISTLTTYTGNTPQTGDSYARIGALGAGLTALAPSSTALTTSIWTSTKAGYLDQAISAASTLTAGTLDSIENRILDSDLGTNHQGDGSLGSYLNEIQASVGELTGGTSNNLFVGIESVLSGVGSVAVATDKFLQMIEVYGETGLRFNADALSYVKDKTDLLVTFPANFSTLGINVSGHVSRVTLVDTTTTNTDMRGTNSAITSLSGIATATNVSNAQTAIIAAMPAAAPSAATVAAAAAVAVVDQTLSGHTTAGTVGGALQAAGGAGDPWSVSKETLEGYGSDTAAGLILKLDVGAPDEPVIVIPAEPVAASVCRVYGYLRTQDNLPAASVLIRIDLITPGAIKGTYVISGRSITVTTNEDGQLVDTEENPYVELIRNDSLTPAGSRYAVTCEALGLRAASMVLDASTFNISSLIS